MRPKINIYDLAAWVQRQEHGRAFPSGEWWDTLEIRLRLPVGVEETRAWVDVPLMPKGDSPPGLIQRLQIEHPPTHAIAHECPCCHAEPSKACRGVDGRVTSMHRERLDLAKTVLRSLPNAWKRLPRGAIAGRFGAVRGVVSVPCPTCGARVGQRCNNPHGSPHHKRSLLAWKSGDFCDLQGAA